MNGIAFRSLRNRNSSQKNTSTVYSGIGMNGIQSQKNVPLVKLIPSTSVLIEFTSPWWWTMTNGNEVTYGFRVGLQSPSYVQGFAVPRQNTFTFAITSWAPVPRLAIPDGSLRRPCNFEIFQLRVKVSHVRSAPRRAHSIFCSAIRFKIGKPHNVSISPNPPPLAGQLLPLAGNRHRGNTLFCRAVTSILSQRLLHKMRNARQFW